MENWNHPPTHVKIIEGYENSSHSVQYKHAQTAARMTSEYEPE